MPSATQEEQLTKYIADAHSIEEQALPQMKLGPRLAGDPDIAEMFRLHEAETEEHERLTRERLEAHGGSPSRIKDAVMSAGGAGFALFARLQPDTSGKLVAHAYSYEHLELASYELLERVAERLGDAETAEVARLIKEQERAMGERLAGTFARAADVSLAEVEPDGLTEQLTKYLADAHALEGQAVELLDKAPKVAGDPELERTYSDHLRETYEHQRLVAERLEAHGAAPSKLKDAAMSLGGLNWGGFFAAHPDTPGKLAAFAYAFEHLEIAGYEQLRHVAERAGDPETVALAERILAEERAAAEKLAGMWDRAAEASLREQGVGG